MAQHTPPLQVDSPLYGGSFRLSDGHSAPYVLPGEVLDPATLQPVVPAPDRVEPLCPHFGPCGGCQYQHMAYPAQLKLKQQVLHELLSAALPAATLPEPEVHAAEPWHYRNRIRLRVRQQPDGTFALGYSRRGSHDFLPIRTCPIAAPLLWQAASTLQTLAAPSAGGDPRLSALLALTAEVELFITNNESALQILFLLNAPVPPAIRQAFAAVCAGLRVALPQLTGAGAEPHPDLPRRTRQNIAPLSWGANGLAQQAAGLDYWLPRGGFFQVNRFLLDRLVRLVTDRLVRLVTDRLVRLVTEDLPGHSRDLAWDLFAGIGLFSRPLALTFAQVLAVEGHPAAAAALAQAAVGAVSKATKAQRAGKQVSTSNLHALHAPVLDFLRSAVLQRERPSLIVLDPPRAGLGAEGSRLLARLAPVQIIYVSCDPTTLAQDLAILTSEAPYRITALHMLDLFPQTYHLETVVALQS